MVSTPLKGLDTEHFTIHVNLKAMSALATAAWARQIGHGILIGQSHSLRQVQLPHLPCRLHETPRNTDVFANKW